MAKHGLIDIYVGKAPGGSWLVSMLSHKSPRGDENPMEWGDTEEWRSRGGALRSAKALADMVTSDGTAQRAVVFAGGRDVYVRPLVRRRRRKR